MKTCFLLCLALLACATTRSAEKVKTEVSKVTLFLDGAQVTRTRQLELPAGETTLRFTDLSPYLDAKSLQVTAKGRLTILSVERIYDYADSLVRTRHQQQLEQELQANEREARRNEAERENVQAEMKLLEVNCTASTRAANVPITTVKELTGYYAAQLRQLRTRQLELEEQQKTLAEEKQRISKELAQAGGKPKDPMSTVEVKIDAKTRCQATFTLVYYVNNAGWYPSYDIRSAGLDIPLALSYKANIRQNTREKWTNVELTLSSANPLVGNIVPELQTYWLDYGLSAPRYDLRLKDNTVSGMVYDAETHEPIAGAMVTIPGTTIGTVTDVGGRYSLTLPNGASELKFSFVGMQTEVRHITGPTLNTVLRPNMQQLDETVVVAYGTRNKRGIAGSAAQNRTMTFESYSDFAEAEEASETIAVDRTQNRTDYEFAIRRPYTIPSDGKPVAVEIGRYDLPANYLYGSTPKIDKDAFLTAEATGWRQYNLLEGEANVYFEGTFVGKSILSPDLANDTLRFSLGRDRGIAIKREKEHDYTARRAVGSNRTQTVGWLLTVRNTRNEAVMLVLRDQLPVSRNSEITVTAEELSGGRLDPDKGLVTWEMQLAPGEQRDLRLHYKVKCPKGRWLDIE